MRIRRRLLLAAALLIVAAPLSPLRAAEASKLEVWKSPTCGCCGGWIKHMQAAGFSVVAHDLDDVDPVKRMAGVPERLASCHTAFIDGYVIEGHVPAGDVRRLLAERPKARGLSAPGMPQSSPGMDMPGEPYDVVLFGGAQGETVFARH